MKKPAKIVALLTAILMMFSLAACENSAQGAPTPADPAEITLLEPTPEPRPEPKTAAEILSEAAANIQKVDSLASDMDIQMELEVMGLSLGVNTATKVKWIKEPMTASVKMSMDMGELGSYTTESYIVEKDGIFTVYDNDGTSSSWRVTTTEDFDTQVFDTTSEIVLFLDSAESFAENGKEAVDGKETTRYDGEIRDETLIALVKQVGFADIAGAVSSYNGELNVSELLSGFGALPVSIWIEDETCIPVKYEMDMTAMMQSIMSKLMESEELAAQAAGNIEITVDNVILSVQITDINSVDSIPLPEGAEKA